MKVSPPSNGSQSTAAAEHPLLSGRHSPCKAAPFFAADGPGDASELDSVLNLRRNISAEHFGRDEAPDGETRQSRPGSEAVGPPDFQANLSEYSKAPLTDFSALRLLLKDYLFGQLRPDSYPSLSQRELVVLQYLLKRKFFYSHKSDFFRRIDTITMANFQQFLLKNPAKKRTQLFKRMIFTKFWRFLTKRGVNVLREYFADQEHFDYRCPANSSGGTLTNEYYTRCFEVPAFRAKFIECCHEKSFWATCHEKPIRTFEKRFGKWMQLIDGYLTGPSSPALERALLMKVRFMSMDSNPRRICDLFDVEFD